MGLRERQRWRECGQVGGRDRRRREGGRERQTCRYTFTWHINRINLTALSILIPSYPLIPSHLLQADLGAVSAEIKDLQERSMDMAQRLRNRRVSEGVRE